MYIYIYIYIYISYTEYASMLCNGEYMYDMSNTEDIYSLHL